MTVTAKVEVFPRIAQGKPLTVTIPAGRAVPVAWNLTAPQASGTLRWQVTATSKDGKASDRLTVTQQVVPAVPVETWAAALTRVSDTTSLPIAAPAGALPGRGSVDVQLTDTLAPPLAGVRDYMTRYPYNCFEQQCEPDRRARRCGAVERAGGGDPHLSGIRRPAALLAARIARRVGSADGLCAVADQRGGAAAAAGLARADGGGAEGGARRPRAA
ncbi:hypothetical protein MOP88_06170 [Sphingomonas sp. WKB10]|nr:hypothetical protein [Sphingomonas sp. WKB10]